jgi:acyl carrier protein
VESPLVTPPTALPTRPGRFGLVAAVAPTVYALLTDRLGVGPELLGPHVALGADLAVDSLDLLEVVIELESAFGIVVPERELDRLRTVADLVHVIAKYRWERDHPEPFRLPTGAAA